MTNLSNNPRPIDLLRERVEALMAAAKLWEAGPEHLEQEGNAARAVDFDQQLFAALQQLKEARDAEVRPHRDELTVIRAAWEPLESALADARAMMAEKLKPYLQAHGSVRGEISGKLRTLRKEWRVTQVVDEVELYLWLIKEHDADLTKIMLEFAQRSVRAGTRDIPGVKIEQVEI